MKFVSVTELSGIGKSAIAAVLALGGLMQIPQVAAVITAIAHNHPHVAIAVGTVGTLCTLLMNPQVQRIIGYVPAPIPPKNPGAPNA